MIRSHTRLASLVLSILFGFSLVLAVGIPPVFAADPPALDGLVDDIYLGEYGRVIYYTSFYPEANATLYIMDDQTIDDTFIWLAWVISRDFTDASYGNNDHYTWSSKPGHRNFEDLEESDMQRLDLSNSCGEMVVDVAMDILDVDPTTPSGYGPDLELNSADTQYYTQYVNGGLSLFSYDTSIASNLNDRGYCVNKNCSVLGLDVTEESPNWADEENYIPASPYTDWEYSLIWEMRIHRDVFITASCSQGGILGVETTPVELHASPSKISKVNSIILSRSDYGDLPDTFKTTLANDGARHIIGDLYLGSKIDDDLDGQPGNAANGDDTDRNDDEDGVLRNLTDIWLPGATVNLYVSVTGSNGYLVGWFDWNGNGVFDANERVIFGSVNAGPNILSLLIPSDGSFSAGDPIYARFRLYDGAPAEAAYYGWTTNGEVEDYLWTGSPTAVTIKSMTVAPLQSFNLIWLLVILFMATILLAVTIRRRFSA